MTISTDAQVAEAVAAYASNRGTAETATIWSERVTVRNPVGTRIAMRAGQVQSWSPAKGGEGSVLLGPLSSMPPAPDSREGYVAVTFDAVAGRNYVLAVETVGVGGEVQIVFQAAADTAIFADLRIQRPTATTIGISDTVTPGTAGPATAFLGLHGFEDEIVAAAIHEIQL